MEIDFKEISPRERYKLLSSTVIPRPIALVSSTGPDGVDNAAPYSFFNVFSEDPPLVILGLQNKEDGSSKDPRNLDILRVRAKQSVIGGKHLEHPEHEAVIGAGKAKAGTLIAADIHEQFGAGSAATDQFGKFGKMLLCRDDEMKAEIIHAPVSVI